MTFSVIVPVYNVEKYLAKCLDSILFQSYSDFEIIVVNDGSPDNSQKIIDEYAKKNPTKIKAFQKENGGLSDARNYGIEKANGDYLLFVDSDDFLDPAALEKISESIKQDSPDVIGFHMVTVDESGNPLSIFKRPSEACLSGEDALVALVNFKQCFEPACGFAYRRDYWIKQNFSFFKGIYHEDFALIPLVVLKAEKVSFLNLNAYYYVSTNSSITRTETEDRTRRLAFDLLKGYDFLLQQIALSPVQNKYAEKLYCAYAANSLIFRLESLRGEIKKEFRKELRNRKISKHIIADTPKRKVRKLLIRIKDRI